MAGLDDEYDLAPDPTPVKKAPPYRPAQAVGGNGAAPATTATTKARPATMASSATGAFVRGNLLVVKDGASLPDRCIKCNLPAAEGRRTKRFAYNVDTAGPGAARLIPVVGRLLWIIWLFQQMATRQYVSISYCVCNTHRKGRLIMLTAMIICLLAGVCLIIAAIMNHDGTSAIIGTAVFLVGAVCGSMTGSLKVANGLHNGAEMTGCGRPFLDAMPKGGMPQKPMSMYGR